MPIRREMRLAFQEASRELMHIIRLRRGARRGQAYIVLSWPQWKRLGKVRRRIGKSYRTNKPALAGLATFWLLVIGISGLAYTLTPLLRQQQVTAITTPQPQPAKKPAVTAPPDPPEVVEPPHLGKSQPVSLSIPAIGLTTQLTTITLDNKGVLQPPERFDIAGWYDKSPTPGEVGPSIIVGHLDSPHDIAVFFYVKTLQAGQTISVTRADGSVANFTVDTIALYDQDNFPTQTVYGNIDYAGLRLITCGGNFNPFTGKYEQNTVVYATYAP